MNVYIGNMNVYIGSQNRGLYGFGGLTRIMGFGFTGGFVRKAGFGFPMAGNLAYVSINMNVYIGKYEIILENYSY